ncbi:putative glycosyltransferase [Megavirus courdo11]|uniref:Putative glycosyltransferase n=2 Tax=Megavirus TaxID=3044761 RepID=K7YEP4_9VIRU|nr:putative glycosyltransferase [Megavirus courdo11]
MSICNKYTINKIESNNNWCLMYIIDTKRIVNLDAEKKLYTQTINNIKNEINIQTIYIYIADESQKNTIQNVFENIQDNLIYNFGIYDNIIQIISNHIGNKNNCIIFTNNTGYINHNFYNNKLINCDLINHIIQYQSSISTIMLMKNDNDKNHQNFDFKLKLSITLVNHKLNNPIKSLDHLIKSNKLITSINKSNIKSIYESDISKNLINNKFEFSNSNNEYIYYPYIDFNISHHKYNKNNYFHIFNTNGYYSNKFDHNPFKDAFKRFETVSQGSFILKPQTNHCIPKIINHIWIDDKISNIQIDYYSYLWKKILKKPWIYKIWCREDIDKYLAETKWNNLYQKSSSIIKDIIVSLAILEKYGGIIINSYTIPLKIIPDDMLSNKFFLGFDSDFNNNDELKLSYRVMASIPGQLNEKNKIIDPYAARRPFDGINNFFRSVKKKNRIHFFKIFLLI